MEIGRRIGERLPAGSIVLLVGPLGAGKTTLAKGVARGLGIAERIISPTFTIVSEYPGARTLHHIDLYRIEGREQIDNLGLDDILWGDGVTLVEWGEKIEADLSRPYYRVALDIARDGGRDIAVEERPACLGRSP